MATHAEDRSNPHGALSPLRAWTLLLASSLTVMSGAIVAPSLPKIAQAFAGEPNAAFLSRLVITLPALAIALSASWAGVAADRFGRRPLLLGCLVLYALAGTSGWYLNDLYWILAGRAVLGVSVAGIMTAASTMIGDVLRGPARKSFLGVQAAFMAGGGVVFVPLGGVLAGVSWQAPFAVYGAALLLLPLALIAAPETKPAGSGAIKASGSASSRALTRVVAGILALAVLFQIAFYLGPVQVPFLVQGVMRGSALQSGLAIALMTLAAAGTSLSFGAVWRERAPRVIVVFTAGVMAVGCAVIAMAGTLWMLAIGLAIFGSGAGWIMPNLVSWMMRESDDATRGVRTGMLTAAIFAGQFLSPVTVQPIVQTESVSAAFAVMAGVLLVTAVAVGVMHAAWSRRQRAADGG